VKQSRSAEESAQAADTESTFCDLQNRQVLQSE
jgi:hypothetical protein